MTKTQNRKPTKKKVDYKGTLYVAEKKNGNVAVRVESTARGQNLIAGVFNIAKKTWHNDNNLPLPNAVREEIEKAFA